MTSLEDQFHERMLEIYALAKAETNYPAKLFVRRVNELRGLPAAKGWLEPARANDPPTQGFKELLRVRRLDLSMEATVLQIPWRDLFTPAERAVAARRLRMHNYSGPELEFNDDRDYAKLVVPEPKSPVIRVFGAIPGVTVGAKFRTRRALHDAGLHRPLQAGISGSAADGGADSIVVSGGYEDDQDLGDVIIYTGHGGNDRATGRQIADQELEVGNLALARSETSGTPVRVIRGAHDGSSFAPSEGYRYDGLYRVVRHWAEVGTSGFRVWKFRLEKATGEAPSDVLPPDPGNPGPAPRSPTTIQRIVRNSEFSREVKRLHDHTCQVCGVRLASKLPEGPYAEGAHIRPLGTPHNGPDTLDNLLCLCPNHHVLFDMLAFSILPDLNLLGLPGSLRTVPRHKIETEYLGYHEKLYRASRA